MGNTVFDLVKGKQFFVELIFIFSFKKAKKTRGTYLPGTGFKKGVFMATVKFF